MIADLKPYSAMKDSGVEWLGEVPEHWGVSQLGRIGRFSKGNGGTKEDEVAVGVPCVRYGDLYTQHQFFVRKSRMCVTEEKVSEYTPILHGDILFAGSGETIEEIGKSAVNLISGPACCGGDVILFRPSIDVDAKFLGYATDCPQAAYQKSCMGRGITVMHIYGAELKYMFVVLPPLSEQAAIVRYLDHMGRRVRRIVRAKQKLIGLLEEQKQAVVHVAVTRGLDPDVPLKDSGVEWLGEVPGHWGVVKIRYFARVGNGSTPSRSRTDYWNSGHHAWLNSSVANQERVDEADQFVTDVALKECHLPGLVPGDVLIAITGQGKTRGRSTVLAIDATINQHLSYVHLRNDRMLPEFLQLVFTGAYAHLRSISDDSGSTKGALTCADIRHFKVPLPPLAEQNHILDLVRQEKEASATTIVTTRREIELLHEYHSRLVSDVVTGKLDVRKVAAKLPEEFDEDAILDDADGLLDDVDPANNFDTVPEEAES